MRIAIVLIPALLLLAATAPLIGEEPETSPADAFRKKVATFPAPSAKDGFVFRTLFHLNGQSLGPCTFAAVPDEVDGKPVWTVTDTVSIAMGPLTLAQGAGVALDSRLSAVSGDFREEKNNAETSASWKKVTGGVALEITNPGSEDVVETTIAHDGEVTSTLAGLLLFCRLAMPDKGKYAYTSFDPDPDQGEKHLEPVSLSFDGPGEWKGGKAFLVTGEKGHRRLVIALHPESRAFLGMRMTTGGGMSAEFLPVEDHDEVDGEEPLTLLEVVLRDPPATGMAVTAVVPGSQAAELELEVGDILVSYAGHATTSMQSVQEAKAKAEGMESIPVVFVRGDEEFVFELEPGQIGINLMPIKKGEPAKPLPKATVTAFDFSSLKSGPRDEWYAFRLGDGPKVGFEHAILRLEGDRLVLRREVAFDGGERWGGITHMDVRVVTTAGGFPRLLETHFTNPRTKFIADGERQEFDDGTAEWHLRHENKTTDESGESGLEARPNFVAEYFIESLVPFMPREAGACFRFRPVSEVTGQPGLPAALRCTGRVDLELTGPKIVSAWRFVHERLGSGVATTHYIDDEGRAVYSEYGGAETELMSKEEALADLPGGIEPRSGK